MPMSDYVRDLRARIGNTLMMSAGAAALVINADGDVLLQKRGDTGRWGLPGGAIEPGEIPADAVVREVWEETGLHVRPERIVGVYGGPEFSLTYPNGDRVSTVGTAFLCRPVGGALRPDGDETLALQYFSPTDALDEIVLPPRTQRRIRLVMDGLNRGTAPADFQPATWEPPTEPNGRSGGTPAYIRALRELVGHDLLLSLGAAAIIFDEAGRVLMQKRGDSGEWGLVGGGVEPGETPADAVKREAWEETGLLVEPTRILGVYGGPDYHVVYPNGDEVAVISVLFACEVRGGELRADGVESLALEFLEPERVIADPAIPRRMRTRVMHSVERREHAEAYFDPPTWRPETD